jgi:RNA polymerase sigma-70 factor (ECF subfamily)
MRDYRSQTDDELVADAQGSPEDDFRAFEELVRRYQQKVLTNCLYLAGSPDDAEDLAQEVMVKLFFGLPGFEGRASFRTWMMRVKSNHCINFVRKKQLRTVELGEVKLDERAAIEPDALRRASQREARDRVGEILLQMPETLRIPLVLRDMDGMEYKAIASELSLRLSAVKMRIMRGRAEFRRLLEQGSPPKTPEGTD